MLVSPIFVLFHVKCIISGCLFNHVTIPSTFTEKEVYSFFEDLFSKPLTDVNTDENTKKYVCHFF